MRKTAFASTGLALLALTSCATNQPRIELRSTGRSAPAQGTPIAKLLAQADGQLALGNVAHALELFRKAARDDPANPAAQSGLARSYERIGRHDLNRKYLERALALAPGDAALLRSLALCLEAEGLVQEAADVKSELASRLASGSAARGDQPSLLPSATRQSGLENSYTAVGSSITVDLPPQSSALKPATLVEVVGPSVTLTISSPGKAPSTQIRGSAPRLERLSLHEVALNTSSKKRNFPAALSSAPLRSQANVRLPVAAQAGLRVLNAARIKGLAFRTRQQLSEKGWRRIAIADSDQVRARSLLLYPSGREKIARRLAAQFGHSVEMKRSPGPMTLLLGRDAALRKHKNA